MVSGSSNGVVKDDQKAKAVKMYLMLLFKILVILPMILLQYCHYFRPNFPQFRFMLARLAATWAMPAGNFTALSMVGDYIRSFSCHSDSLVLGLQPNGTLPSDNVAGQTDYSFPTFFSKTGAGTHIPRAGFTDIEHSVVD